MSSIPVLVSTFYFSLQLHTLLIYQSLVNHVIVCPIFFAVIFTGLQFGVCHFDLHQWIHHLMSQILVAVSRYLGNTINIYIICRLYADYSAPPPPLSSTSKLGSLTHTSSPIFIDAYSSFTVVIGEACGCCHSNLNCSLWH